MKNKLLLLLTLGVAFFSACSDDDDTGTKFGTYNEGNLELSVSGVALAGKVAVFNEKTLTLEKAIPGEASTVFTLTSNDDTIRGENINDSRELRLKGTISNGKLSLNVAMKVKSSVVGKWNTRPFNMGTGSTPLYLELETTKEQVIFGESTDPSQNLQTPETFVMQMKYFIVGGMLNNVLEYVTLEEDGNITASYSSDMMGASKPIVYEKTGKGLVLYNVIGDKIYISLNLEAIQADAARANMDPLASVMAMLEGGIPLNYSLEGNNLNAYVTRDVLLPLMDFVPLLVEILPAEFKRFMPMLLQIATIVKESTRFDVGLVLVKDAK